MHSDQCSQFTATHFKTLLARHEAVASMSRRGHCDDNARPGAFWNRFKAELPNGGRFPGLAEATF